LLCKQQGFSVADFNPEDRLCLSEGNRGFQAFHRKALEPSILACRYESSQNPDFAKIKKAPLRELFIYLP